MIFREINIPLLVVFVLVHITTVALVLLCPFEWQYLLLAVAIFYFRWLGFTCVVHRYFSHKAFRTSRLFQFVLGVWATLTMVRSPIRFASGHRHHHLYSDQHKDLHSIHAHGFLRSYMGWVISKTYHEDVLGHVGDLKRYPELVALNRLYFLPNLAFLYGLFVLGGLPYITYGGFVSIVLTWHTAFAVTVLFHTVGRADYETYDESRNSMLLALLTLGEGWHNNHHANMSSAKLGHRWWQLDIGYFALWVLSLLGLVWDLNSSTSPVARFSGSAGITRRLPVALGIQSEMLSNEVRQDENIAA